MFAQLAVAENNRVILTRNNRFARLLTPGVHRIFAPPLMRISTEWHDVRSPLFKSKWAPFLVQKQPSLVAEHFVVAKTGSLDVAMITVNGALYDVILPEKTVLFWKAAGRVTVEVVNIGAEDTSTYLFSGLELHGLPAMLDENADDWVFEALEDS